ncbi:hypothetical protein DYB38_009688 [Aphanomyces astaci]|uniref:Uncharacterized protein n=1 Tax=Aphanomyces astaci TaxID=112090 RepID=A0A397D9F2_APHAT|nr:hypothetical protein DYB38_009688 [Aphanomyces astaci]
MNNVISASFDMVLQIYINCYVGEFPSEAAKRNTTSAWPFVPSSISNPPYPAPTLNSNITHRLPLTGTQLGTFVDAAAHPVLGPLFQSLPPAYWQYVSASNLGGAHSYTYDYNSLMTNLVSNMYKCVVVRPTITAPPPARRRILRKSLVAPDTIVALDTIVAPDDIVAPNTIVSRDTILGPRRAARQRSEFRVMTIADRMQREICQFLSNRDLCTRLLHYIECAWTATTMGADPVQSSTFSGGVGKDADQMVTSPCTESLLSREALKYSSTISRGVNVLTRLLNA